MTTAEPPDPPLWTTLIHPACICEWEKAEDEPGGYWMVRLVEHCTLHRWVKDTNAGWTIE